MLLRKIPEILFVLLSMIAVCSAGNPYVVRDGVARMEIVIAEKAPEPVYTAAKELQKYVYKTTGVKLKIVNRASGKAIYVGDSLELKKIGFELPQLKDDEYLIKSVDGNIVLAGHDEYNIENAALRGRSFNENKFFQKTGTLYAVNDFLEKFCKVRWYMIGELGEVIQPAKSLSVPADCDIRHSPSVKFRSLYALWNIPKSLNYWTWTKVMQPPPGKRFSPAEILEWGRRMKVGGKPFAANHNQYDYYKRFSNRPNFFAFKSTQRGNQLCYSNPQVVQQLTQDAADFFDGKYTGDYNIGDYFSVMPADTINWCVCEKCLSRYGKPALPGEWHNGSKSDYVWGTIAEVAKNIKKTHPGKFISCCAYSDYTYVPQKTILPDNVAVCYTKNYGHFYDLKERERVWRHIADWRQLTPEVYLWDYYLFPESPAFERFPNVSPRLAASEIYRMKELDIHGGLMCQLDDWFWRSPAIDHIRVYVTMKLLDNWNLDVKEILDEYYRLFYGPAELEMRSYWEELEKIYLSRTSLKNNSASYDWLQLCPPEKIKKLDSILKKALKCTIPGSIYAARVILIRDTLQKIITDNCHRVLQILSRKRSVNAIYAPREVRLDGKLSDSLWKIAGRADNWTMIDGGEAFVETTALVLYDQKYLYIGFVCDERGNHTPSVKNVKRDSPAYLDDSVELFIAPEKGGNAYHFAVNSGSTIFDERIPNGRATWNSSAIVATNVSKGRWTVEMKIPLSDLGISPGDNWSINFCRNRFGQRGLVFPYMNWSGPNGYHNRERFGKLIFKPSRKKKVNDSCEK